MRSMHVGGFIFRNSLDMVLTMGCISSHPTPRTERTERMEHIEPSRLEPELEGGVFLLAYSR